MPRKKKPIVIPTPKEQVDKLERWAREQLKDLEQFPTGAVRRKVPTVSRTDLIPLEFLLALGERYHYGATVRGYGERNWEKGIDYSNLLQHMQVHLQKLCEQLIFPRLKDPETGEYSPRANAAAIAWGCAAIIHFLTHGNPVEPK